MRISVDFQTDKLPLAYRMAVLSIIKEAIKQGDYETYLHYFDQQLAQPKPYASAVYLKDFQMGEPDIQLSGFKLHFTTSEYGVLLPLLRGLQSIPEFTYKQYRFKRMKVMLGPETRISSNKIIVSTMSPILIEDEQGKPVAPGDPRFNDHFNEITNRLSLSLRNRSLQTPVKIAPIVTVKRVIKELNHTFLETRKSDSEYLTYTAYSGRFLIEGHPHDLQWLLDVGAGLRRGQSFGMLALEREVIK